MGLGFSCLGHDEQAAGVLVYAVNQPYLRTVDVVLREVFEVPGYGIQHGAVPIAESRVDDHACRLVYDHEVVVFIHDVERYVFGGDFVLVERAVEHDLYDIVGLDLVGAFDGTAVDHDEA